MAARTSTGPGLGIAIALLGILTLALFVLTFVFLGQKQNAEKERADLAAASKAIVAETERNTDSVRGLIEEAGKSGSSVVMHVQNQQRDLALKVTGNQNAKATEVIDAINKALGEQGGNLLGTLATRDAKIAQLDKSNKDAEAARQAALADLQSQAGITKRQKDDYDQGLTALTADIGKYKSDIDAARGELDKARGEMGTAIDRNKREFEDKEADLNSRIAKANDDLLVAQAKVRELQSRLGGQTLKPADEYALVDGEVIGIDASGSNVFLNRGRSNKIVLGLTFEVYTDATSIRPDPRSGEFNRGKATVEVIKIDADSSTARIIRNPRGNPVVKGDVIANAIYDPKKIYTFLVYGNFDFNNDGRFSAEEQVDITVLVNQWGGKVTETLTGDVDFVILGLRPIVPPAPPVDAPPAVVEQHVFEVRKQQQYDRLLQQATATSIPVLNQNRLFTLIGR